MSGKTLGRMLAGVAGATAIGLVLAGCVIIPFPLTPLARPAVAAPSDPFAPANPFAPSGPTTLAVDPVSLTLRNGVPVVRLCEAMTVDWLVLSESLLTDDPSKGYVDVWQAVGYAHLAKSAEFVVGTAPLGLKPTTSGNETFDFTDDDWKLSFENFDGAGTTVTQKFRARDLSEGVWLDDKGRTAAGPCEPGA